MLLDEKWVPSAGPYLGYLGARYRSAAALWNALEVERDLTPDLIKRAIEDLARSPDNLSSEARTWYGSLVATLEAQDPPTDGQSPRSVLALTDGGWVPADQVFWTSRREVERAFGSRISWWRPGPRDPSTLRRAAEYLGVREVTRVESGGTLSEKWTGIDGELIGDPWSSLWTQALHTWRGALQATWSPEVTTSEETLAALMRLDRCTR